jgi:hypothetical protein
MGKIPGYRESVQRVAIHFATPSLVVQNLSLAGSPGNERAITDISSIIVGSHWKKILTGALAVNVQIDTLRLQLDLESFRRDGPLEANPRRTARPDQDQLPWQDKVKQFPAFRLTSAILTDGEVHLREVKGQNWTDLPSNRSAESIFGERHQQHQTHPNFDGHGSLQRPSDGDRALLPISARGVLLEERVQLRRRHGRAEIIEPFSKSLLQTPRNLESRSCRNPSAA